MKHNKNGFFHAPWATKFISACKKIESDLNYQPDITDSELFNLVVDECGNSKHIPRRSALAIQPSTIRAFSADGNSLGMIYQIKVARKSFDDYEHMVWNIDDSAVILVDKKGQYSLHSTENAEKGNFNSPIRHLKVNQFLNQRSLHCPDNDDQKHLIGLLNKKS